MKKHSLRTFGFIMAATISSFIIACNSTPSNSEEKTETKKSAMAAIEGVFPDTSVTGSANFTEIDGGKVELELSLTIPAKANETVAVHIHENGACGDMGKAAGGHWNPTNEMHGQWGGEHFHSGDIGNVTLDADGKGSMKMQTDRWTIGGDATKDILSHSIIVHGGTDDYTSQPAGNAGTRIACGVIKEQGSK